MSETVEELVAAHRRNPESIAETVRRSYRRLEAAADPAIFITVRCETEAIDEARRMAEGGAEGRPLYGIPVAIKDNIDCAGLPTTAACPAFRNDPSQDALAVARLRQAGAIVIGKTNLDQFATGLVGVRSPYGTPRNPMRSDLIPGGSSSGSAVAVARGIVPLALGTDTAGSGRIPAGLNNIVGLKPSVGLVPLDGVLPACRSLDCVSIFALTATDALVCATVMTGSAPQVMASLPPVVRVGVPRPSERIYFGDAAASAAFEAAIARVHGLGWSVVDVDLSAHIEAAKLLYEGAWLAERTEAVGEFITANPDAVHPITRRIIEAGGKLTAVDAFKDFYRLAGLRTRAAVAESGVDVLMVPTAPTAYTVAEVTADPVVLNTRLGTYTNFVNLFGMAGIAVPSVILDDGTPVGVTFLASSGRDVFLAGVGAAYHAATGLPLGALGSGFAPKPVAVSSPPPDHVALAVVGAHMSGMPLNRELTALGGTYLETSRTSADYRLFALAGTTPTRPGLLRGPVGGGHAIEVEVWSLPAEGFGRFVASVPAPLSIGTVRLNDGRGVKGFLVEAEGVAGARDVSSYGGWRTAIAALAQ